MKSLESLHTRLQRSTAVIGMVAAGLLHEGCAKVVRPHTPAQAVASKLSLTERHENVERLAGVLAENMHRYYQEVQDKHLASPESMTSFEQHLEPVWKTFDQCCAKLDITKPLSGADKFDILTDYLAEQGSYYFEVFPEELAWGQVIPSIRMGQIEKQWSVDKDGKAHWTNEVNRAVPQPEKQLWNGVAGIEFPETYTAIYLRRLEVESFSEFLERDQKKPPSFVTAHFNEIGGVSYVVVVDRSALPFPGAEKSYEALARASIVLQPVLAKVQYIRESAQKFSIQFPQSEEEFQHEEFLELFLYLTALRGMDIERDDGVAAFRHLTQQLYRKAEESNMLKILFFQPLRVQVEQYDPRFGQQMSGRTEMKQYEEMLRLLKTSTLQRFIFEGEQSVAEQYKRLLMQVLFNLEEVYQLEEREKQAEPEEPDYLSASRSIAQTKRAEIFSVLHRRRTSNTDLPGT